MPMSSFCETNQTLAGRAWAWVLHGAGAPACRNSGTWPRAPHPNSVAVVLDLQKLQPAPFRCDGDVCRACVERVLEHLLDGVGGPVHHLACSNSVHNLLREPPDGGRPRARGRGHSELQEAPLGGTAVAAALPPACNNHGPVQQNSKQANIWAAEEQLECGESNNELPAALPRRLKRVPLPQLRPQGQRVPCLSSLATPGVRGTSQPAHTSAQARSAMLRLGA